MMGLLARTIMVVAVGLLTVPAGTLSMRSGHKPKYVAVAYCDLIRNQKQYNQKLVRVSAIYRYGYEWSELYCLECLRTKMWVDFDESFASSTKATIRKKLGENGFMGRTVSVIMVGKFNAGGGYGHMGAYRFRLLVSRVEKVDVILNDSPSPNALPKEALSRIHCP